MWRWEELHFIRIAKSYNFIMSPLHFVAFPKATSSWNKGVCIRLSGPALGWFFKIWNHYKLKGLRPEDKYQDSIFNHLKTLIIFKTILIWKACGMILKCVNLAILQSSVAAAGVVSALTMQRVAWCPTKRKGQTMFTAYPFSTIREMLYVPSCFHSQLSDTSCPDLSCLGIYICHS